MVMIAIASSAGAQTEPPEPEPRAAAAQSAEQSALPRPSRPNVPGNWGVTIWGVSYHIDKTREYNGQNWGLGVRHYSRPDWGWLGSSRDTRTFVEIDALKNSWKGVVLPVSAGVEYKLASLSDTCSVYAVAMMTVAYYHNAVRDVSHVRAGPVPGVVMGCGRVRSNAVFVLSPKSILGVVAGSWTIVF